MPIADTILLVKLIPVVESSKTIDKTLFDNWYNNWPKDETQRGALNAFIANRNIEYWQNKSSTSPKAKKSASDWEAEIAKLTSLDLLRHLRNATVPHEGSRNGYAIKAGARAFIKYIGRNSREKASEFIAEATTFIKKNIFLNYLVYCIYITVRSPKSLTKSCSLSLNVWNLDFIK